MRRICDIGIRAVVVVVDRKPQTVGTRRTLNASDVLPRTRLRIPNDQVGSDQVCVTRRTCRVVCDKVCHCVVIAFDFKTRAVCAVLTVRTSDAHRVAGVFLSVCVGVDRSRPEEGLLLRRLCRFRQREGRRDDRAGTAQSVPCDDRSLDEAVDRALQILTAQSDRGSRDGPVVEVYLERVVRG